MKKLARPIQVQEVENEGLISLLGKRVTFFCLNYIYTGTLDGVNDTCLKLIDPAIVYETGDFSDKKWKDAQPLPSCLFLQLGAIEAFGEVK